MVVVTPIGLIDYLVEPGASISAHIHTDEITGIVAFFLVDGEWTCEKRMDGRPKEWAKHLYRRSTGGPLPPLPEVRSAYGRVKEETEKGLAELMSDKEKRRAMIRLLRQSAEATAKIVKANIQTETEALAALKCKAKLLRSQAAQLKALK